MFCVLCVQYEQMDVSVPAALAAMLKKMAAKDPKVPNTLQGSTRVF